MVLSRRIGKRHKRPWRTEAIKRYYVPMPALDDQPHNHATARNRFLAACSLAGAATTAYRNAEADPSDPADWIDIARLGSPDARAVLLLSCGLNGEESHCGAAILTDWLSQGLQRQVPRDVGLIMLHSTLPLDFSIGSAAAPEKTHAQNWSDNVLSAAARRFSAYAEMAGLKTVENTPDPEETRNEHAWMRAASNAIADEIIEHAHDIAVVEFHTGLRPYGDVAISSCHAASTDANQRIKTWFGDAAGTQQDRSAILDIFSLGFGDRMVDLALTAAHVEFGTYTMGQVLGLDARRSPAERHADMRALFNPNSDAWRQEVSNKGARIIEQALQGLADA